MIGSLKRQGSGAEKMKRKIAAFMAILLFLTVLPLGDSARAETERPLSSELSARLADCIKEAVASKKSHAGIEESETLLGNADFLLGASSTDTDWMALAMGRFCFEDPETGETCFVIDDGEGYSAYLGAMKEYIETAYRENNGILHRIKATEWHRAAVAVAALGGDPLSFGTYDGKPINLVADGSYDTLLSRGPGGQGINGWIWGLISMDIGNYEVPEDAKYPRERFITEILKMQLTDGVNGNGYGGWVLGGYGSSSDVDITAMAIQALAPYYNDDTVYTYVNANSKEEVSKTVRQCVNEALDRLASMMNEDAGFSSWNTDNIEGISQVVVALASIGIDPAEDGRFITKDGKTLLDGLLNYRVSDGGFSHTHTSGWNSMANDQAAYALVAYWRLENGMRALYDMRGEQEEAVKKQIEAVTDEIASLPSPTDKSFKESLGEALESFRAVPADERRYVYNYNKLAEAISLIGGEKELESAAPYAVSIKITAQPDRTDYYVGETFDKKGMKVAAVYSDGTEKEIDGYRLSIDRELALGDSEIYVSYGILKAVVKISVEEKMPWEGEGSEESPYLVDNAEALNALSEYVNKGYSFAGTHFGLAGNIDLSDTEDWTPIGKSASVMFEGVFDGQGYAIDNLCSTRGGLFGYAGGDCVIKNVVLGSGEINSKSSFVGGILGWSEGADIFNCLNGADIQCSGYGGGIAGTVRNGGESTVEGCCNIGSVTGTGSGLGGIVGHLATSRQGAEVSVTVKDCYNTGKISGRTNVGGIAGQLQDGHVLKNCYNAGEVCTSSEGSSVYAGPIAGSVTQNNVAENLYYCSDSYSFGIANSGSEDASTGVTEKEMLAGDFCKLLGEAFKEDRFALANGGFPLLYWQKTEEADEASEMIDAVIDAIEKIGEVTKDSGDAIEYARRAYDGLDGSYLQYVENYQKLVEAEEAYAKLKESEESKPTEAPSPAPSEPASPTPSEPASPAPSEPVSPAPSEPASPAPSEPASPAPSEPASPLPTGGDDAGALTPPETGDGAAVVLLLMAAALSGAFLARTLKRRNTL